MKGFVKILEVVIASVIILTTASFFFSGRESTRTQWDAISAELTIKDALAVLHRTGALDNYIMSSDAAGLRSKLSEMLPQSIEYSVVLNGMPNSDIRIGCLTGCDELRQMLNPLIFNFKDRKIRIAVQQTSLDNIHPDTDIIFIREYQNMSLYRQALDNFLLSGGTIFLFSDITDKNIADDEILRDIFGLSWTSWPASQTNRFYDTSDPSKVSYRISDYFSFVYPRFLNGAGMFVAGNSYTVLICEDALGKYVKFNDPCRPENPGETKYRTGDTFRLQGYDIRVYNISRDYILDKDYADMGILDKNYNFKGLLGDSQVAEDSRTVVRNDAALSAVKSNTLSAGRAIWFCSYTSKNDFNQLLKATILWSSGESYVFDPSNVVVPEKYSTVNYLAVSSSRPFEAYAINLKYWWSFA